MLAAYVRSLYDFGVFRDGETLTVPCMVDLRRHMKQGGLETGLTNHTGFMTVSVASVGATMRDTLDAVAKAMEKTRRTSSSVFIPCPFSILHMPYSRTA